MSNSHTDFSILEGQRLLNEYVVGPLISQGSQGQVFVLKS